jgi:hypothetical protein
MRYALVGFALLAACPYAQAQTNSTPPPANPLSVTPVQQGKPAEESPDAAAIRARLEAFGYDNVTDLQRDSTGVWRARALKDNKVISVTVDKGGRITQQRR